MAINMIKLKKKKKRFPCEVEIHADIFILVLFEKEGSYMNLPFYDIFINKNVTIIRVLNTQQNK
jgi:hypothetical protein